MPTITRTLLTLKIPVSPVNFLTGSTLPLAVVHPRISFVKWMASKTVFLSSILSGKASASEVIDLSGHSLKMISPNAMSVSAASSFNMVNRKPFWYASYLKLIAKAMSSFSLCIRDSKHSVAIRLKLARPHCTSIGSTRIDVRPETLLRGSSGSLMTWPTSERGAMSIPSHVMATTESFLLNRAGAIFNFTHTQYCTGSAALCLL